MKIVTLAWLVLLTACSQKSEEKKPSGPPPIVIITAAVLRGPLEVTEESLGTLEATVDPKIAAEVPGKVLRVLAFAGKTVKQGEVLAVIDAADLTLQHQTDQADRQRLDALLVQQDKLVARQNTLVAKGFISQNAADDVSAQHAALVAQRNAAQSRTELSQRNIHKTTVRAPAEGIIENQLISAGDYVKLGDPLFLFVSNRALRAHLPFPESAATRLKIGQTVALTSPQAPGVRFDGRINDIRPQVSEGSRALIAIVDIRNGNGLLAGGTVNASVSLRTVADALQIPEQSVVLRPAGKVAYAIVDNKAEQRVIQTGTRRNGLIEIIAGLREGEVVAQDGAGFLTQGTVVTVKKP